MRHSHNIRNNWFFCRGHDVIASLDNVDNYQSVELPHNAHDVPFNYFDEASLHGDYTYHYPLEWTDSKNNQFSVLRFEGVMCDAHVYVNGKLVAQHSDGFTPFDVNISPFLQEGKNLISVTLSGLENPLIPPFGGQLDFLCFPGIYRDVSLTTYSSVRIKNLKVETYNVLVDPTLRVNVFLESFDDSAQSLALQLRLINKQNQTIYESDHVHVPSVSTPVTIMAYGLKAIELWGIDNPNLYRIEVDLISNEKLDTYTTQIGFREAEFRTDGFYLNGERVQLVGINRHQSFPYIGYAMGKRAQQDDADIVKNELGFNLVRTSHYPQSPDFLDRCDEIGLLVFEEIPGWQHVGEQEWQDKSVDNVQAMIERDWNHPSIILWGVRINESADHHDFYLRTNQLAKSLDSTRQTGGVRCIQNSEFLEDVYTMNDFILSDSQLNPNGVLAVRSPQNVTGLDKQVPYMITEYAGHMYPTKRQDCETWQIEHVTRHLRVLDASFANPNISGAIAWCLFDYNTHQDFGSGDKICYHGIMDAFRIPKFAASVYASQMNPEQHTVLQPVTYWTRGDRPEASALPLMILTNCDSIEIEVLGSDRCETFYPDRARFPHLPHPPVIVDRLNQRSLPLGDWGHTWNNLIIRGYTNGKLVMRKELAASPQPTELSISLQTSHLMADCSDTCRVTIKALDQHQQLLPYCKDVLSVSTSNNLSLIGPSMLALDGGAIGLWVKAHQAGEATITVTSQIFGQQTLSLTIAQPISQHSKTNEVHHG
ncbi:glycoside hydrolase family 2 protein [Vibrio sinensis]|uniref:Glycoside hydrolase family 2 protein n=1 Tax=Vibrio sinensis TaxID=2302434 RepID=A0A3A6R319_9VIBR|nr:glycoside hydrolase family 2 TIM barrel-domain containing protein [Vibrio sinensis]RJX75279.1 glycoside hydrolase family 2 protein [Vibrio sinensis]